MKPGDRTGVPTFVISLRQTLVSALALTCVGLGVFAFSEYNARLAAQEQVRSLQDRLDKLAKARPALASQQAFAPPQATFPAAASEASEVPGAVRADSMGSVVRSSADFAGLMDSPEVQQLMSLRGRGALDSRYAALFKSLGLPPDQLQKFQQLLVDKQSTMRDVMAAMRSQGLTPTRENAEQIRALAQNANAEIDDQIQSTLGPTGYAQYQSYEQTQPQRATVERVQQRLSYSGEPLSDQQAASLVNLLVQTAPPAPESAASRYRFQPGNTTAPITEQAVAQAKTVLSPGQVAALQELQAEQQAQAQLSRRARENFTGARPAPPSGN